MTRRDIGFVATRLLLVVGLIWAVLAVFGNAFLDEGTALDNWDDSVNAALAAERTPTWDTVTRVISGTTDTITVVILATVAVLLLWFAARARRAAVLLALAVMGEAMIFVAVTAVVDRDRPEVTQLDHSPPTASFPSGHTAAGIALYGGLAVIAFLLRAPIGIRIIAAVFAVVDPLLVGVARMYRGMHHPTDVLASVLLGSCWLAAVVLVVLTVSRDQPRRGTAEPVMEAVP